ncbi:MAG: PP2C family protein-serine/threonine phosphatase, partial [Armatimonadota bacterium]|nr:PP2C family protein-serine/threonine phosphatase [Armatimonadota bacterium]
KHEPVEVLNSFFRDGLQLAVLEFLQPNAERTRRVMRFFSVLGDTYWEANTDNLRRAIREQLNARLHEELRIAKGIQERLLPKVIPQIPGWQFAGRLKPALEVGGDYWSVKHYTQDGMVTCKLADVTGHGIGAAILVAAVKFISGGFYRGAPSAAWVMERTNHVLVVETPSDIMVTMVYGWIRPQTGEVTVVNAGHGPAYVCQQGMVRDIPPTGPALGLLESRYTELTYSFAPGDLMVLCSDGIVEARSHAPGSKQRMFGAKRLRSLIRRYAHLSAQELADQILNAAVEFSGDPSDDMSLMIVKRVPDPQGSSAETPEEK